MPLQVNQNSTASSTSNPDGSLAFPLQVANIADTVGTVGALNALNATATVAVNGQHGAAMSLASGTFIGTLTPEVSTNGGTTWIPVFFYDPNIPSTFLTFIFSDVNPAKQFSIPLFGGVSNVRVRVSSFTSGTANATLRATTAAEDFSLVGQGSVTAGQPGNLILGAVSVSAPNYTTGQSSPTSLTTAGAVRVDASGTAVQAGGAGDQVTGANILWTQSVTNNMVTGTANTTGTTSTSLVSLVATKRLYITSFSCANTGATTSLISFQDGSGGATQWATLVPAGGVSNLGSSLPMFRTTAGVALFFAAGSASTTIHCSASGFSGT